MESPITEHCLPFLFLQSLISFSLFKIISIPHKKNIAMNIYDVIPCEFYLVKNDLISLELFTRIVPAIHFRTSQSTRAKSTIHLCGIY